MYGAPRKSESRREPSRTAPLNSEATARQKHRARASLACGERAECGRVGPGPNIWLWTRACHVVTEVARRDGPYAIAPVVIRRFMSAPGGHPPVEL
jgi:hypothetical protein